MKKRIMVLFLFSSLFAGLANASDRADDTEQARAQQLQIKSTSGTTDDAVKLPGSTKEGGVKPAESDKELSVFEKMKKKSEELREKSGLPSFGG